MQGRLTPQQVLATAKNCLDTLTVPPLLAPAMNEAKEDFARLTRVINNEEKLEEKIIDEDSTPEFVRRLHTNILFYLSPQYYLNYLYGEEKFDEGQARLDKLYIQRQENGFLKYTVKKPDNLFVSHTLEIHISECKSKEEMTNLLSPYKEQILAEASRQNHLLVKPIYPSKNFNALHNLLLLLGDYFPHKDSLDDKALYCQIETLDLTPESDYFMDEERSYHSASMYKRYRYADHEEMKYKNPSTKRMYTDRDKDRIDLFYLQQLFPEANPNPGFFQRFEFRFSEQGAKKGIDQAFFLLSLACLADSLFFHGLIFSSVVNFAMPSVVYTFIIAMMAKSFWLGLLLGMSGILLTMCAIILPVLSIGALAGGLKIYYTPRSAIPDAKERIGDLPDFRNNKDSYMNAGNRYTLFSNSEAKKESVQSPESSNHSPSSPASPSPSPSPRLGQVAIVVD